MDTNPWFPRGFVAWTLKKNYGRWTFVSVYNLLSCTALLGYWVLILTIFGLNQSVPNAFIATVWYAFALWGWGAIQFCLGRWLLPNSLTEKTEEGPIGSPTPADVLYLTFKATTENIGSIMFWGNMSTFFFALCAAINYDTVAWPNIIVTTGLDELPFQKLVLGVAFAINVVQLLSFVTGKNSYALSQSIREHGPTHEAELLFANQLADEVAAIMKVKYPHLAQAASKNLAQTVVQLDAPSRTLGSSFTH